MTQSHSNALFQAVTVAVIVVCAVPGLLASPQTPPQPPAPPAAEPPPPPAETYSYNPAGRRDPFVSLALRGGEAGIREGKLEGREGLLISELTVRGIVRTRNTFVAMVQGPDNRTHIVRTGDQLFDGVVKAITADAVIFSQDVNDPLSLVKQREVRKALRGKEEGT
jgi:Tfp pilus assembly protein PilP